MIKTDVFVNISYNTEDIKNEIYNKIGLKPDEIISLEIFKKALKITPECMGYTLTVLIDAGAEKEAGLLKMKKKVLSHHPMDFSAKELSLAFPPVIVGAGPAGLFSALVLAEAGAGPIVLERGDMVEERQKKVFRFSESGLFDAESNVQFGEGGAGAFSDGKLKVGGMDKYKRKVLGEFILAGADESIMYTVGAHLGTDRLPLIVKNIRDKIISLGGRFIFGARLSDFTVHEGKVSSCSYIKDNREEKIDTSLIILATGHSARDTFRMLYSKGLYMQPRGFGVGMRVEHPREYINRLIYKDASLADTLGTASYHLVSHTPTGRSLYSFCMCPGGTVVPAAGTEYGVVTNGMSEFSRMADNSNSALLVSVTPSDFSSEHPLAGLDYQEKIEKYAYLAAGGGYLAPAVSVGEFMEAARPRLESTDTVTPSYPIGITPCDPCTFFGDYITDTMKLGLVDFDEWLPGFLYRDAFLTAPETRSTSAVRILRDEVSGEAVGFCGIYPIGEGAGYAGGIVSAAVDGVRIAEKIINSYSNK